MNIKIFHTGPLEVNTYLLMDEDSKEAVLIDVGGDFEDIYTQIKAQGYQLKYVLNTHCHFDHVLGETIILEQYPNIPVYMHKDDVSHIEKLDKEMKFFGIKGTMGEFKINTFIDENTELTIGNKKITILHTPGHSKGSLCYYVDGKLFSGDALFQRSIGRTDFYDGDYDTLIESIKTKLLTLDENTIVYPGHGPITTIKDEKRYNIYLK